MTDHHDRTRAAYDAVVEQYAAMFADGLRTRPFARSMVATFAELVRATGNPRAADVGCGPGHVTAMLHDLGLDAFGLDLSPAMVGHARRAHPALRFAEARMEALPVGDGALGGVLSHYSTIPPRRRNSSRCSPNRPARSRREACSWSRSSPPATVPSRSASTTRWRPPTAGPRTASPSCSPRPA